MNTNHSKNRSLIIVGLLLLAGVTLYYGITRPYMHDDSVNLIMAEEMYSGNGAYHFYDNKPPGLYAVMALGIKLFGYPDTIGRVFAWLASAVIAWLATLFISKEHGKTHRLVVGITVYLALFLAGSFLPLTDVGLTLFSTLGFVIIFKDKSSLLRLAIGGAIFALAFQFKQTALALPVAVVVALGAQLFGGQMKFRRVLLSGLAHGGGFFLMMALIWGIYASNGLAETIWQRCFLNMASGFEARHSVSFGLLLVIRTGWFILPGLLFVATRLWGLKILKDPFAVQVAVAAGVALLYPLTRRFYCHYIMATIPLYVFLLHRVWVQYECTFRVILTKRRIAMLSLLILGGVVVGIYVKRESFEKTFVDSQRDSAKAFAMELGSRVQSKDDMALFLEPGPNSIKPSAMYFYTGMRPPIKLLFFHNVPETILEEEIGKLPKVIRDPRIKFVTFNPEHNFHGYYYPLSKELREKIHTQLQDEFVKMPKISKHLWVRKNIKKGDVQIYRGPFAGCSAN